MSSVGDPISTTSLYPKQREYLTQLKVAKKRSARADYSVAHRTDPSTARPFAPGAGSAVEYYSTDADSQYDSRVPAKRSETDRFIHRKPTRGQASWWFAVHSGALNGFVYHAIKFVQVPEVEPQSAVASPAATTPALASATASASKKL